MAIELTTYQIPDEGQDIEIYLEALLGFKDIATGFSRSLGRVSWIQGQILLRAGEQCKNKGDWTAFLASVGMKKETAYLLRRIATDIVPEKQDLEYSEMLAIVFPNSYGKHLRDKAGSETFGTPNTASPRPSTASRTGQTVDKVYSRLASVKNSIQKIADREFIDSKLSPDQVLLKYAQALEVIDVCQEELGKLAATLKTRKQAFSVVSESVSEPRKAAA